jgi:hypothetical protein
MCPDVSGYGPGFSLNINCSNCINFLETTA